MQNHKLLLILIIMLGFTHLLPAQDPVNDCLWNKELGNRHYLQFYAREDCYDSIFPAPVETMCNINAELSNEIDPLDRSKYCHCSTVFSSYAFIVGGFKRIIASGDNETVRQACGKHDHLHGSINRKECNKIAKCSCFISGNATDTDCESEFASSELVNFITEYDAFLNKLETAPEGAGKKLAALMKRAEQQGLQADSFDDFTLYLSFQWALVARFIKDKKFDGFPTCSAYSFSGKYSCASDL